MYSISYTVVLFFINLFFIESSSNIESSDNIQFAASGVAKLVNENSNEIVAEIRVAYRIWLITNKLTSFLKQRKSNDFPISDTQQFRNIKNIQCSETQTDEDQKSKVSIETEPHPPQEDHSQNGDRKESEPQDHVSNHTVPEESTQETEEVTTEAHINKSTHQTLNSSAKNNALSFMDVIQNLGPNNLRKFPLLQELYLELERIESLKKVQKHPVEVTLANFERLAMEERRAKRHENCKSAYNTGPGLSDTSKSFNLFSKIYSAKVPAFGVTKNYMQKVMYHPLFYPQLYYTPPPTLPHKPKRLVQQPKIKHEIRTSMAHRETQANLEDFEPKFKDASIMTVGQSFAEIVPSAPPMQFSTSTQTDKDVVINESPTKDDDLINERTVKNWLQNSSKSMAASRRMSRMSVRRRSSMKKPSARPVVQKEESYSSDFSSEKESGRDGKASPLTDSIKTQIQEESVATSSSDKKSIETNILDNRSESSASASSNSLIQTLTSMRMNLKAMEQQIRDSSTPSTVKTIRSTTSPMKSAKSSGVVSEKVSQTSSPVPETIQKLAEKNLQAKAHLQTTSAPEGTRSLSPVSQYLEKLRSEEKLKRDRLQRRRSTIRTESVSFYMPTDLDVSDS